MGKKIDWYLDFVDLKHKPSSNEVVALFYYEGAKGLSKKEVVGRIASESSVGTWTTLPGMPVKRINKLKAKAYRIKGNFVFIAYPLDLWEQGSIPQLMSGIAGNILGMKAVRNLRLVDAYLPKKYLKHFKGPNYGKNVVKFFDKNKQFLSVVKATVVKPKLGYTAKEHARLAYELFVGGIDCVKDDENLTNQSFNRFEERVKLVAKARDRAEKITGDKKDAFINVTSPSLKELEKRIKLVHSYGFKYFMIDVVLSGFTALGTAVELARELKMAIHGHRAMHAAFTRNKKHGITMHFFAKLMRIIGIDQLHIGTVVGKLEGDKTQVLLNRDMLYSSSLEEIFPHRLKQEFYHIKPSLPVSSGGLHPGILPTVLRILRQGYLKKKTKEFLKMPVVVQVGGGVLGHPKGARAGAKAVVDSIRAFEEGVALEEAAKKSKELALALKKWGKLEPK